MRILIKLAALLFFSITSAYSQTKNCDCSSMLPKNSSKGIKMRTWQLECLAKDTSLTLNRDTSYEFVIASTDTNIAVTVTNSDGNNFSNEDNGTYYSNFSFTCPKSTKYRINVKSRSNKKLTGCLGIFILGKAAAN